MSDVGSSSLVIRRRDVLRALSMIGVGITSPAWAAVEAGVRGNRILPGEAGRALSAAQAAFLDVVSEQIIPRTNTPGASDVGVVGYIDQLLEGFMTSEARARFIEGVAALMRQAQRELQTEFVKASPLAQHRFLARLDATAFAASAQESFFRELKRLVVSGYCTSEPGATQVLEYLPVPGGFKPSIAVTAATRNYVS